jgi:hypothetical protein
MTNALAILDSDGDGFSNSVEVSAGTNPGDANSKPSTADTTAPTVSISSPTGGTVSGTITVSANASDNVGVVGVQFKLDGVNLGIEDTVAPYSVSWNTTTATNASHTLTAVARDAAGNTATSAGVMVTVSNSVGGTTPLNDTTEFVKQQYRDFLNREAEPAGLQYWVNIIDSGAMTRAQVIESFFWSEEFGATIAPIVRLYFAYFLRVPDYEGLMYRIDQFSNGQSLEATSDAFAASPEFQQTYGALSNEAFVDLVYQNILGRAPDQSGYAFWVEELNSGRWTRGQVMIGFSESPEYEGLTSYEVYVTMMYIGMLRRSPDEGGFNFWVNYLGSGNSGLALIDGFLNSQEYAARF